MVSLFLASIWTAPAAQSISLQTNSRPIFAQYGPHASSITYVLHFPRDTIVRAKVYPTFSSNKYSTWKIKQ